MAPILSVPPIEPRSGSPQMMTLPNYFLADLPPEATLSAAMVGEACQTLKRNRGLYLARFDRPPTAEEAKSYLENNL